MTTLEKLIELLGDEGNAQKVLDSGFMVPIEKFTEKNKEVSDWKAKFEEQEKNFKTQLTNKDNELYEFKTSQMTEAEKLKADNERLTQVVKDSTIRENKSEQLANLLEVGYGKEEAQQLVDALVTEDKEKSSQVIGTMIGLRTSLTEKVKEDYKNELLGGNQSQEKGGKPELPKHQDEIDKAFAEGTEAGLNN